MSNDTKPTQNPPEESAFSSGAEDSKPSEQPTQEAASETATEPSAELQQTAQTTETGFTASTWLNSKKIVAAWSINQNRNSWLSVEGVGWKKLANNSDSAVVALTILGLHALQTGRIANLREEDGQIKEIYAW